MPLQVSQLHPSQRDIYIDQLINNGRPDYNIGCYTVLNGPLDTEKFRLAVRSLPEAFDVYKLRFDLDDPEPQAYFDEQYRELDLILLDFSDLDPEAVRLWMKTRLETPFRIKKDEPLFEQYLIKVAGDEHWYFYKYHHLITDGQGISAGTQYVARKYRDDASLRYPSYREEVRRALSYSQSEAYAREATYWTNKIAEKPQSLLGKGPLAGNSQTIILDLPAEDILVLEGLQSQTNSGLQSLTLAALLLYFGATTEETEFIFGTPIHRRGRQANPIVGMFSGILPFKGAFQTGMKVIDLVKSIALSRRQDYRYPNYQIGDLSRHLKMKGNLMEVIVNQATLNFDLDFGKGLDAVTYDIPTGYARYPLELFWRDYGKQQPLQLKVDFQTAYFTHEEALLLVKRLLFILRQFPYCLDVCVEEVSVIPDDEAALLKAFNGGVVSPDTRTITALFEEQVAVSPEAVALQFEDQTLTYRELDEQANRLAHYLRSKGIEAGTPVAICMERSPEMIIGIWGVLKAGGAYIPIDPSYPQSRIDFILKDTNAPVVLTHIDLSALPAAAPMTPPAADTLAYIIYTSGSTGNPKGVAITHKNLVSSTLARRDYYGATGAMLLIPSFSFDSSVAVIFGTLCTGGKLLLSSEDGIKDAGIVKKLLAKTDTILCVPTYYRFLLDEGLVRASALSRVILAGEALDGSLVRRHFSETTGVSLYNEYGPTECTVWSTVAEITPQDDLITIGRPLSHLKVYIVDRRGDLLPIGVSGELYIGGPQVARGYINLPALTDEKFIPDFIGGEAGARLYKTGDMARWLPDGRIEYMGRIDDQVKIRGYRIELGEIEQALQGCRGVKQAVVTARSDDRHIKRLVGYIVANSAFEKTAALSWLKETLPEYMVPSVLVVLDHLPLSANGKVDKKALPAPDAGDSLLMAYTAPRNEPERLLASIWQELLGVERVGIYDNFLEIGGDSIISMQVVSRAQRHGFVLKPKDLFTRQTISGLSELLFTGADHGNNPSGALEVLSGPCGQLPIQQWYLGESPVAFFQQVVVDIDKGITATALSVALKKVIRYHDALRFVYRHGPTGWEQTYGTYEGGVDVVDARSIREYLDNCGNRLDITQGILIQAALLLTPSEAPHNRVCLVIHHLAVDGVSWRILLEDLELLLQHPDGAVEKVLGAKSSAYRAWYDALDHYSKGTHLTRQVDYWTRQVDGHAALRVDKVYNGAVSVKDMDRQITSLDTLQTRRLLQEAPKAYHTEINDILLCALALALSDWNNTSAVLVGVEGHGREEIAHSAGMDITRTVGWFTTQYPVLLEVDASGDIGFRLRETKEQLRRVPDKGLGYGVLKYMCKAASLQGSTPWEIGFNYLGQGDNMMSGAGALKLSLASLEAGGGQDRIIPEKLYVNAIIREGKLVLEWDFSRKHYEPATIAQLAGRYQVHLESLIAHCVAYSSTPQSTPSDYGLGGVVGNRELEQFIARRGRVTALYRLSPLQEGMLFHGIYEQEAESYIEQFGCDMSNVQERLFAQSWERILQQHTIFRSGFYPQSFTIPVQCVYGEVKLPFTTLDYREMAPEAQQEAIREYLAADRRKGFDFESAPLMRICLIRLSDQRYRLQWSYHHLLLDGWSLPLVIEELLHTYESLVTENALEPVKEDRFEDYIRYLERRDIAGEEQYWRAYLQGMSEGTLLPFIKTGSDRTKAVGAYKEEIIYLSADLDNQIRKYVHKHHITLNTLMQGVWAYLLYRYTGRQSVVYGVTVAGRPENLPGVERAVGLYINTLPLRGEVEEDKEIVRWLQAIQTSQLQSREHQYAPLNDLQRWVGVRGDLFDSLLVFENYPVSKTLTNQSWRLRIENIQVDEHTNYPLCIMIQTEGTIRIDFGYNARILEAGYIARIAGHFEQVLSQIIAQPFGRWADIELLTVQERHQLLGTFNDTKTPFPADKTITALFEEQAALTPEAIAVEFEDRSLTYRELNGRANQLAAHLYSKGVTAGSLVPVYLERSLDMMVALLGILKAGGAYIPLDPDYPVLRFQHQLSDSNSALIVTALSWQEKLHEVSAGMELICVDDIRDTRVGAWTAVSPQVDSLAYVMYTSGSTGRPKGVAVTHRNVVSMVCGQDYLTITSKDAILSAGSLTFDAVIIEHWGPLLNGGRLVLSARDSFLDTHLLKEELRNKHVNIMTFTTSWFNQLVDTDIRIFEHLRAVMIAGEKLSEKHAEQFRRAYPDTHLINGYGPTENTVLSLSYLLGSSVVTGDTPIGRPLNNRTAYVLDAAQRLQPIGVAGELYVGGEGVARGYLHMPELTAERFVPDPFTAEPEKKLYKTGDIARWLPDGNIEYLGRMDDQLKIRGHRIEPGDIAHALEEHASVQQALVLATPHHTGQKYLVGYILPRASFDKNALLDFLKSRLPDHMIPAQLIPVAEFPLTPNGKIDKKALPAPDNTLLSTETYIAPRDSTEQTLVEIWQELLGIPRIGAGDNFFDLGGHSLLAMRLQSALRKRLDVEIPIKAIFGHRSVARLALYIREQGGALLLPPISAQAITRNIPLSFAQERLWFIDRLEGSLQYHILMAFRVKGDLQQDALEYAIREIINRHEVLRTVIKWEDDTIRQQVLAKDQWRLQVEDGPATPAYIRSLTDTPFDLSADHMLRAHLIPLSTRERVLVLIKHHIASDGWSLSIFVKELTELYEACVSGRPARLPALSIQYRDYAIWQRTYLSDAVLSKQLAYWKDKLAGVPTLQLPLDYPRPPVFSTRGAIMPFQLDAEVLQGLKALSGQQGATLFMTLLTAFKVLLYRYTGQGDICVGSPISGRTRQETEGLIGCFVNTLALRSDLHGNPNFTALLQQVKETTLNAYEHQDAPFEKIVELVVKERDLGRSPLFQVMFVLQNIPPVPSLHLGGAVWTEEVVDFTTAQVDLNVTFEERADGLSGSVEYGADLFRAGTITRMITHFKRLLQSVLASPASLISDLPMLSAAEEHQLLHEFNDTATDYPKDLTILDLFNRQVEERPSAIAVLFEEKTITYRQLQERSNQLAHYLRQVGVNTDVLVPLCTERSMEMMIAILGIIKAGGAYVPIDPEYPPDRIGYMLEVTSATMIVCSKGVEQKLKPIIGSMRVIGLDEMDKLCAGHSTLDPLPSPAPEHLAYVIFTSGSTGKPKGAMLEHGGLVNVIAGQRDYIGFTPGSRMLQFASFGFDASCLEIFHSLAGGGVLVLPRKETLLSPRDFTTLIDEQKIDFVFMSPSYLFGVKEWLGGVKTVILGGEPLNKEDALLLQSRGVRVINIYGPTETTIYVVSTDNPVTKDNMVVIGKPVANTKVYIQDAHGGLCPVGIPGEICVSGPGLARGYAGNPEWTAARFVRDPYSRVADARMYRTGDLGRWLPDGNIECLGRIDDQVKVRGYRIELGEIEQVLQESDLVSQAVVLVKGEDPDSRRLVGYIVPRGRFDREGILSWLKKKLPDFMIPAFLVELTAFPLTANGKIDKKALPEPDISGLFTYAPPRNGTEEALVAIWQRLLKIDRVGIYDNFFELGGHSLLVTRVISAMRKTLDIEMTVRDLLVHTTIAAISTQVQSIQRGSSLPDITAMPRQTRPPLSSSQQRLWFIDRMEGSVSYHIPFTLKLQGVVNRDALAFAFKTIIERHEVLRTVFLEEDGVPYQQIMSSDHWHLQKVSAQVINAPFDLQKDYMLRATLIERSVNDYLLIIVLHHIAADGWSLSILAREWTELYLSFCQQRPHTLLPLPVQYADYALWQLRYLEGTLLVSQLAYWKSKLADTAVLQLPTDHPRPALQSTRGQARFHTIDKSLTEGLELLSRREGATLFMTLLSVFKVLLYRYSGQDDICVGSPIANRTQQAIEPLIGFFVNTIALRSDLGGDPDFTTLLSRVKTTLLEAYVHQDAPFDKVVEHVVSDRDMSRSPLFQVMFILQNTPEIPRLDLGDVQITEEMVPNDTAKFDLTVDVIREREGLNIRVEYCSDLYEGDTIDRMMDHYLMLLHGVVADPGQKIGALPMITPAEQSIATVHFVDYPRNKCLHHFFEEQVARFPAKTALVWYEQEITYAGLDKKANQVASAIRCVLPQAKNPIISVLLDRGPDMVVTLLGILKAGGAYLPLDPDYPSARIRYMLEDSRSELLITHSQTIPLVVDYPGKIITIDDVEAIPFTPVDVQPDDLAYIIYTSGSTGQPKGVMIEHRNVVRLLFNDQNLFDFTENDTWTLFHSYCFDFSVWEMYGALLFGGKLVIIPKTVAQSPKEFIKVLTNQGVTVLNQTPGSFYNIIAEEMDHSALRYVIFGGEALKPGKLAPWKERYPSCRLINMYGITETTVHVTYKEITSSEIRQNTSNIGRPIPTVSLLILDRNGKLVPPGVAGELYVGGAGLARGYLNRPELTAERFIDHPYIPGEKLYRTGDLAKMLTIGDFEYLGRIDHQVKIRGFRIELGEIESKLLLHSAVEDALVIDIDNNLCAYVVTRLLTASSLKKHLSVFLPDYMIPSFIMIMESFPLTNNGKIDRKRLPLPEEMDWSTAPYEAPATDIEKTLATLWTKLLNGTKASLNDHFFELGGHSLKAAQLAALIHKSFHVEISIKSIFATPVLRDLAALITRTAHSLYHSIAQAPSSPYYPASSAEKRLFILNQIDNAGISYNIPGFYSIEGNIDLNKFSQAIRAIISRHDILRTYFVIENKEVVQKIQDSLDIDMEIASCEDASLQDFINHFVCPFDLSKGPLIRIALVRTTSGQYFFGVDIHHIIADGISVDNFIHELSAIYSGIEPPPLSIQYKDFSVWQKQWLQSDEALSQKAFWRAQFEEEAQLINMPVDYARPPIKSYEGALFTFMIPLRVTAAIKEMVNATGATPFMVMLATYTLLLSKYSGQQDIVVGTPVAGRAHADLQDLIGMFVNTIPLRNFPAPELGFMDFVRNVKESSLKAFENQHYPFEELLDDLEIKRDMGRNPLFDYIFTYESDDKKKVRISDLLLTAVPVPHNISKMDMSMAITEGESGELLVAIEYATRLFAPQTIKRLAGHFTHILEQIIADPQVRLRDIEVVTEKERAELVHDFNNTGGVSGEPKHIYDLFEENATRFPNHIAVEMDKDTITYKDLNEKVGRLADILTGQGCEADKIVGLYTDRSIDMIVGILAVLKAGAAYLPLDPDYPQERVRYMLEDSAAILVLTQKKFTENLSFVPNKLFLDDLPTVSPAAKVTLRSPNHLAYVIYTSGSTGKPKGVQIEHGSLYNFLFANASVYENRFSSADVCLHLSSISFDASVLEIFIPLAVGARLVLIPRGDVYDVQALASVLINKKITFCFIPPSLLQPLYTVLKDSGPLYLTKLDTGAESVKENTLRNYARLNKDMQIVNSYGPTEATVASACYAYKPGATEGANVPIGKPIHNARIYIVNEYMKLQPIGVPGELCIAGQGLARGYLNNPGLTKEKFIDNPFEPGTKLYKTGDLAKWKPDGNIDFIGRTDHQVKIRGFRIELGEIESKLMTHPDVKQALVIDKTDSRGDKFLCAYILSTGEPHPSELRAHLATKLPAYMLPSYFITLDKFPLTKNEKINRKALPEPDTQKAPGKAELVLPVDATERRLLEIWKTVLESDHISVTDNFFEIGGNSLKIINMLTLMQESIGDSLKVSDLFDKPSIREQAAAISKKTIQVAKYTKNAKRLEF